LKVLYDHGFIHALKNINSSLITYAKNISDIALYIDQNNPKLQIQYLVFGILIQNSSNLENLMRMRKCQMLQLELSHKCRLIKERVVLM